MGFKDKPKTSTEIVKKNFGVGSAIVNGKGSCNALIVCVNSTAKICLMDMRTFIVHYNEDIADRIYDPYHLTTGDAELLKSWANSIFKQGYTFSDYGWNSIGLKATELEYGDN